MNSEVVTCGNPEPNFDLYFYIVTSEMAAHTSRVFIFQLKQFKKYDLNIVIAGYPIPCGWYVDGS